MNVYMVLKVCKQCFRIVVIDLSAKRIKGFGARSISVAGNLPELYSQMCIGLELDGSSVIDYNLSLTERNKSIIEKNGVDLEEYKKALEIHKALKRDGCGWNVYRTEAAQLYKTLPFEKADHYHKALVGDAEDRARVDAINNGIIKLTRSRQTIEYSVDEFIGYFERIEQVGSYEALPVISKIHCLASEVYGFSGNKVYDFEMKTKKDFINENIQERLHNSYPLLRPYEIEKFRSMVPFGFAQEQLQVLDCLTGSIPCIVTGRAGTGKTSVIKLIIDCYSYYYGTGNILLIAPTGKASRRLYEKTGMPACTIHKALRKKPDDDFVMYNERNPLPHKLVIVDESSMIDTLLMYDLLNAVAKESKIIFAGDHNQLSPVGYGEPFFDFLKVLPVSLLTQNHRQSEDTDILAVANNILEGNGVVEGRGVSVSLVSAESMECIIQSISTQLDDKLCQIISPFNELNAWINSKMKKGPAPFNIGDKVILRRNTEQYCNGDIGYVKDIEYKRTSEEQGASMAGRRFVRMQVVIEGKAVDIFEKDYEDVSLAYAITVHKMQGSENEQVIFISPFNSLCMSNTRLLYTAATRARKKLDFVLFQQQRKEDNLWKNRGISSMSRT